MVCHSLATATAYRWANERRHNDDDAKSQIQVANRGDLAFNLSANGTLKDQMVQVDRLAIPDVLMITPKRFADERGFFMETYSAPGLAEAGYRGVFVQDNHSFSATVGTVRGLHFQSPPYDQDKLVRVNRGAILDVAVDIRPGSPTYGQHVAAELSASNCRQLLVPSGFAHGFQTLESDTEVLYKVTAVYAPSSEGGLLWSDPGLKIDWPISPAKATVKSRDLSWPTLAELVPPFIT